MSSEIRNARVTSADLGIEDHGFLSSFLVLDKGDYSQGYGGFVLGFQSRSIGKAIQPDVCGEWVKGVLKVCEKEDWKKLPGSSVRAYVKDRTIRGVGHFLRDEWLYSAQKKGIVVGAFQEMEDEFKSEDYG